MPADIYVILVATGDSSGEALQMGVMNNDFVLVPQINIENSPVKVDIALFNFK